MVPGDTDNAGLKSSFEWQGFVEQTSEGVTLGS